MKCKKEREREREKERGGRVKRGKLKIDALFDPTLEKDRYCGNKKKRKVECDLIDQI